MTKQEILDTFYEKKVATVTHKTVLTGVFFLGLFIPDKGNVNLKVSKEVYDKHDKDDSNKNRIEIYVPKGVVLI
jgi:hypothetical protein